MRLTGDHPQHIIVVVLVLILVPVFVIVITIHDRIFILSSEKRYTVGHRVVHNQTVFTFRLRGR